MNRIIASILALFILINTVHITIYAEDNSATNYIDDILITKTYAVSIDTFVNSNSNQGTPYGNDAELIAGKTRTALFQLDLTALKEYLEDSHAEIMGAEFSVYFSKSSTGEDFDLRYIAYDNWDNDITYNIYSSKPELVNEVETDGEVCDTFIPSGTNESNKEFKLNIGTQLMREMERDDDDTSNPDKKNKFSLSFRNTSSTNAPTFRTKEYETAGTYTDDAGVTVGKYAPKLTVHAIIPPEFNGQSSVTFGDNKGYYKSGAVSESNSTQTVNSGVLTVDGKNFTYEKLGGNGYSGMLMFETKCDPVKQNYLTVQLWGSDTGAGMLWLMDPFSPDITPAILTSQPPLYEVKSAPMFEGQFFYVTYLIPRNITDGKESVWLKIVSTGGSSPYNTTSQVSNQSQPSCGIYSAHMSTSEYFIPSEEYAVGSAPDGKANPDKSGDSTDEARLRSLLQGGVNQFKNNWIMYGSTFNSQVAAGVIDPIFEGMVLKRDTWKNLTINSVGGESATAEEKKSYIKNEYHYYTTVQNMETLKAFYILAKAYYGDFYDFSAAGAMSKEDMFNCLVKMFDFMCVSQGKNGGWFSANNKWLGADVGKINADSNYDSEGRRNASSSSLEGFGLGSVGAAFVMLYEDLSKNLGDDTCLLDVTIDHDDNSATFPITRWEAYGRMFYRACEYLSYGNGVGHAPNQDMADILGILNMNKGLALMNESGHTAYPAYTQAERESKFEIALGLKKNLYNDSYWVSNKGTALESGGSVGGSYTGDYGTNLFIDLGELVALAEEDAEAGYISQECFEELKNRLKLCYDSIGNFYSASSNGLSANASTVPILTAEGVISWRNTSFQGTERYPLDEYGATVLKHPAAIKIADYYLRQHYRLHNADPTGGSGNAHYQSNVMNLVKLYNNLDGYYGAFESVGYQDYEFPAEGDKDFVFTDEMAQVVAFKDGNNLIYAMLNWRHGYRNVNSTGVVHHTTDKVERIAYPEVLNSSPLYSGAQYEYYGGERTENNSYFSGLSYMRYGDYIICVNGREIELPFPFTGKGIYTDLVSGEMYNLASDSNVIPPETTLVLKSVEEDVLWRVSNVMSGPSDFEIKSEAVIDKVIVKNVNSIKPYARIIATVYDSMVLTDIDIQDVTVGIGNSASVALNVKIPKDISNCMVKIFVWDGDTLNPLADVKEY